MRVRIPLPAPLLFLGMFEMFGIFKFFRTSENRGPDYEAIVETECPECYIRIVGYKEQAPSENSVFISMFTAHNQNAVATWAWRRTRIWRILRGFPDPDYEILTPEVMDATIQALSECRKKIFGNASEGVLPLTDELLA